MRQVTDRGLWGKSGKSGSWGVIPVSNQYRSVHDHLDGMYIEKLQFLVFATYTVGEQ